MCKIEGVFAKQYCLRSRAFALHFRVIVFYVRIARKVKMLRAFLCFACGQHRKVVRAPWARTALPSKDTKRKIKALTSSAFGWIEWTRLIAK